MSDMINERSLMEPFAPGVRTSEENWKRAFGKVGKYDDVEASTKTYQDRVKEYLERNRTIQE